jgi:twitching motility protein PilT
MVADGAPAASPGLVRLVERAGELRATDVHLRAGEAPIVRIDGRLRVLPDDGASEDDAASLLAPCLTASVRARLASGSSADFPLQVPGRRLRVNVYATSDGVAAAIRLLPGAPPPLSTLHLPASLEDLVDLPHGLVIVCGPTGSGKSTTLAALAQEALRRRSIALVTLEDPIEYVFGTTDREEGHAPRRAQGTSFVRQRQIGRDVRDFATGLRDALREDPDVLVVGEMRDPETISLALTAAETGHLVLTSLHSRSAPSAVERIVDTYAPERQGQIRVQLADALRAVVSQRLLPRAKGTGRVAALEVMRVTHGVAASIRDGKTAQLPSSIQAGRREGMLPLESCLADMVKNGTIALESARAVANEMASLESYLRQ